MRTDLIEIKNKYGDERRTEIAMNFNDLDIEDLIEEEDCIITLTHNGYTKRMPVDTYKSQRRGGRGITGMTTREEDFVEHLFTTSTHDNILFFTTRGIVYKLKGYQIPEATRQAKGMAIVNLLPLEQEEKISAMIPIREFEDGNYLTFVTKNGTIKKTDLMDYSRIRQKGLRAIELAEDDELISVNLTDGEREVMIATHDGMAIRFNETDVRGMGRTARGVRGIRLSGGDYVVSAVVVDEEKPLLMVTENGYGKKTGPEEYRSQTRGGKGIFTYRITDKTGKLVGMTAVSDNEDVMLITSEGIVIRMHTDEISTYSRQTQGVRLMRLDEGVSVVSLALTERDNDDETDAEETDAVQSEETADSE